MTIGFNAVASLAAGKVDAATGFWNAEGVALRRQGVPIRIFKVDDYGAPPYPELILTTSRKTLDDDPSLVDSMVDATTPRLRLRRASTRARPSTTCSPPSRASTAPTRQAQLQALLPDLRPRARSTQRSCANGPPGTSSTACSNSRRVAERSTRLSRLRTSAEASGVAQPSSRSTSSGSSRAIRERGTTRSTPAASAARRVSTSTCE